jgi:hypothetical protein
MNLQSRARGYLFEPERCHACHRPAIGYVKGRYQTLPICSICRWARSRPYRP